MKKAAFLGVLILAAGCEEDPVAKGEVDHGFSYEGEHGPEHWGTLPGNAECSEGTEQSPIALSYDAPQSVQPELDLAYSESRVAITNSGHGITYDYDPGSTLRIGEETYELRQFHFHAPSEHLLDGRQFPMEVHLVHQSKHGDLAVLGVFIDEGQTNPTLDGAEWKELPDRPGGVYVAEDKTVHALELIPSGKTFRYAGSLTTPPCSQGVSWNVFSEPIEMSKQQIEQFRALYANNARPIQDTAGRPVVAVD